MHASFSTLAGLPLQVGPSTYGPLLGLFSFGLFTRRQVKDRWVLYICLAAPFITYLIEMSSKNWFDVGFLTILINGALTFGGLWSISHQQEAHIDESDPSIL